MANHIPSKPRAVSHKAHFCIVASRFNEEFTDALVENAVEEFSQNMPEARVDVIRVPGAFEIPVTLQRLLELDEPQVVIALGVILRGQTAHADLVAQSVTHSLQELALKHNKPVLHEVLLLEDEKQAYARCIGPRLNRGREAARSAQEMWKIFNELEPQAPRSRRLHPSNV